MREQVKTIGSLEGSLTWLEMTDNEACHLRKAPSEPFDQAQGERLPRGSPFVGSQVEPATEFLHNLSFLMAITRTVMPSVSEDLLFLI